MFYLREILHKLFRSSTDSKKYKAFEFDNHLLRSIRILEAYYDPRAYIAVSISISELGLEF